MKHPLLALLFACLIAFVFAGCRHPIQHRTGSSPRLELHFEDHHSDRSGTWKITHLRGDSLPSGYPIHVSIRGLNGSADTLFSFVQKSDFEFTQSEPYTDPNCFFEADAGKLQLSRPLEGQKWTGNFQLHTSDTFDDLVFAVSSERMTPSQLLWAIASNLKQETVESFLQTKADLSGGRFWNLVKHGVSPDYTSSILAALPEGSIDDVIELNRFGVSADQVRQFLPFDTKSIVEMRRAGVSADYAAAFREFNPLYTASDIASLRRFGVPSDWSAALRHQAKIQTSDDLITLRRFGVPISLARAAHRFHFVKNANDIATLRRHGVSTDFLTELREVDQAETPDGIIRLRRMGVSADYYNQLRTYGSYSIDDIILMRRHGIHPDLVASTQAVGKKPLTARAIIDLKNKGVSPETIRELRQ